MMPASMIEAPNPSILWYFFVSSISKTVPDGFASANCTSGLVDNRSPAFDDTCNFTVCPTDRAEVKVRRAPQNKKTDRINLNTDIPQNYDAHPCGNANRSVQIWPYRELGKPSRSLLCHC